MKYSLTFVVLTLLLAGCDFLGISGDQYLEVSIQTDKEKYFPEEKRVLTFTNNSDRSITIEYCSWSLEKKVDNKWKGINGAACNPELPGVSSDVSIKPNGTYSDTLRFTIKSGAGYYRYRYRLLDADQEELPEKYSRSNTFGVVEKHYILFD